MPAVCLPCVLIGYAARSFRGLLRGAVALSLHCPAPLYGVGSAGAPGLSFVAFCVGCPPVLIAGKGFRQAPLIGQQQRIRRPVFINFVCLVCLFLSRIGCRILPALDPSGAPLMAFRHCRLCVPGKQKALPRVSPRRCVCALPGGFVLCFLRQDLQASPVPVQDPVCMDLLSFRHPVALHIARHSVRISRQCSGLFLSDRVQDLPAVPVSFKGRPSASVSWIRTQGNGRGSEKRRKAR